MAAGLGSGGEVDVGGVVEVAECLDTGFIPNRKVEAVAALVAGSKEEGVIATGTVALTGPPSSRGLGRGGGLSQLFRREHESLTAASASESDVGILLPGRSSCVGLHCQAWRLGTVNGKGAGHREESCVQKMQGDGVSRGEEAMQVFQGAVQSRIPLFQGDGVSCGEAAMQVLQENSNPRGMGSEDPSRISALRSRDGEHVLEKLTTGVGEFCCPSVMYGGPSPGESTFFKLRKSFSWPLVDQNVSSLGVVPGSCSRHVGSIYRDRSNFLDSNGESSVGPVSLSR